MSGRDSTPTIVINTGNAKGGNTEKTTTNTTSTRVDTQQPIDSKPSTEKPLQQPLQKGGVDRIKILEKARHAKRVIQEQKKKLAEIKNVTEASSVDIGTHSGTNNVQPNVHTDDNMPTYDDSSSDISESSDDEEVLPPPFKKRKFSNPNRTTQHPSKKHSNSNNNSFFSGFCDVVSTEACNIGRMAMGTGVASILYVLVQAAISPVTDKKQEKQPNSFDGNDFIK